MVEAIEETKQKVEEADEELEEEIRVHIKKGDRIAQILFHAVPHYNMTAVEELDDTDRGESGFGSSG